MTTSENVAASVPTPGRALNVTLWVFQVLLGALFVFAGVTKLMASQEAVDQFAKIGLGDWFLYFTGAVELAGGVGLLIPRLCGLAALGLVGVMIGAVLATVLVLGPPAMAVVPAAFGAVLAWVAWGRWPQTKVLFGKPTR